MQHWLTDCGLLFPCMTAFYHKHLQRSPCGISLAAGARVPVYSRGGQCQGVTQGRGDLVHSYWASLPVMGACPTPSLRSPGGLSWLSTVETHSSWFFLVSLSPYRFPSPQGRFLGLSLKSATVQKSSSQGFLLGEPSQPNT